MHWLIEDGPAPSFTTLRSLADLVDDLRADGKRVLIHCAAGINRSGLLSAAALIRGGHDADEAIALVREARTGALNNVNFVELLHDPRWSPRSEMGRQSDPHRAQGRSPSVRPSTVNTVAISRAVRHGSPSTSSGP